MIQIWRWDVALPPGFEFLEGELGSALATLGFWLLVALVLQFVILRIAKAAARRISGEVEDVIIDVTRRPLIVAILLVGARASLAAFGLQPGLVETLDRWLGAGLMGVATYWLYRMLKEVVLHYGERLARRSENRVDDVLLPIVNQFAPLALFLIGGSLILQHLGLRLDALLVAIGGAAFILAFALQDILSNVFSGLSLLVDTPFRYGDLVQLEDGKVCQVVRIGVRVTQLYDIDAHAVIYMPNSKLANERLVNLMQPTAELISTVRLELGREQDIERVRSLLNQVLGGHPDLLGPIEDKLPLLEGFELLSPLKRQRSAARLHAEAAVDQAAAAALEGLRALAALITRSEHRGFSRDELAQIRAAWAEQARHLGELRGVDRRLDAFNGDPETFLDQIVEELGPESLAACTWAWVNRWTEDPDLLQGADDVRLRRFWSTRVLGLLRRVDETWRRLERPDTLELRLDDHVLRLRTWLAQEYKAPASPWKWAGATFKGFENGAAVFSLFFFVDNIELEHFFRQARVETELRREVARRMRKEGIAFASPRYEVAFLETAATPRLGAGRPAALDGGSAPVGEAVG